LILCCIATLYCDTNGHNSRTDCFYRLLHRLLQCVLLDSLGPLRFVRCIVLLHRVVHSLSVHYCSSCVVVRFIHHVLLRALILSILASNESNTTDPANHHHQCESMMTGCYESSINPFTPRPIPMMSSRRCQSSLMHQSSTTKIQSSQKCNSQFSLPRCLFICRSPAI
jgi:hypothetical protein